MKMHSYIKCEHTHVRTHARARVRAYTHKLYAQQPVASTWLVDPHEKPSTLSYRLRVDFSALYK